MSNHPFGLRGDPFVPPATLSAKEASRLIRRRVRACNGDGGALYPIATCDSIHALARGVPEQVLELAGRALRIAAAEGAPAVSPAHAKQAAEAMRQEVAPAPREAPEPEPALAAAPRAEQHAAGEGAEAAADDARGEEPATLGAAATAPEPVAEAREPIGPGIEIDDPESDLPPFRPASVALPTRPSDDLPEEAREWVSRFIPSQPTLPPAMAADAPRVHVPALAQESETEPERVAAPAPVAPRARSRTAPSAPAATPPTGAAERLAATVYAAPPRRGGRARGRSQRQDLSRMALAVLSVAGILVVVLRYSSPARLHRSSGDTHPVPTSAPAGRPAAKSPAPAVTVTPEEGEAQGEAGAPAGDAPAFDERAGDLPSGASLLRPGATPPAPFEPPARVSSPRFALEVASFIFEDRARIERDRLAAAGLRARVVTTLEFGSRVYRVVVGGYPHPAAAERAADSLLSNGVVLQARVVNAPR